MNIEDFGLGRLHAPDSRDANFPMQSLLKAEVTRTYRYWNKGPWQGNQGRTSQCVAYAGNHWLHAGPVIHRSSTPKVTPLLDPTELYNEMQRNDEWPGEDYNGTSVRALCKILQSKGLIDAYYWGTTLDEVVDSVLDTAPVVMGTSWYTGMFTPDSTGLVKPTGTAENGHAWMVYGVNRKTRMAACLNSWGLGWGRKGKFRMHFDTLEMLIGENGEAMLATEAA